MKDFALAHPYITLFALMFVCNELSVMWVRLMRYLSVRKAGWPPSHLDADGDWRTENESLAP